MTQTWDCAEARTALGVYVLGAIDPAERGLVDAHLLTCQDCRDELAGLAGLPALLARVNPDEVSRICADDTVRPMSGDDHPPEELLGTVLGLAEARRRRNRWRYLSAAAAVAAIAGGLFAGLSSATSTTVTRTVAIPVGIHGSWETVAGTNQATGATATVAYSQQSWGSALQVLTDRIPLGTTCQLWVVHPDGTWTQVAAWTTARDEGHVWYAGSMASTAGSISKFLITAGKKTLLTVTPT
jgi:predicted anti-sigma-YlaC factor YlaD